ncbi:hypothetical protein OSB04_014026 [Centaurea solstitialis]|uniref:Uncharacterized protein n=1 Tax=Centaurea solstitialis TaxID=347529 RepID=A0AA38WG06_9ASTR|nr:hypothetical protein OSB04_014026 [Centaurea solstitialis]
MPYVSRFDPGSRWAKAIEKGLSNEPELETALQDPLFCIQYGLGSDTPGVRESWCGGRTKKGTIRQYQAIVKAEYE